MTAYRLPGVFRVMIAQHVGMPAPEGMSAEQRAKFLARLATPDGLAKLVAFAKEHP